MLHLGRPRLFTIRNPAQPFGKGGVSFKESQKEHPRSNRSQWKRPGENVGERESSRLLITYVDPETLCIY